MPEGRSENSIKKARIVTIGDAMADQFGSDAVKVATLQTTSASDEIADVWSAVLAHLVAQKEKRRSDDG